MKHHNSPGFDFLNIIKLSVIVFSSFSILIFSLQISKSSFSTQTSAQNNQQQLTTTLPPNTLTDEQLQQLSKDPNFVQKFVEFLTNYLKGNPSRPNPTSGQPNTPPENSICNKPEGCGGNCQPSNNADCGYGGCRFWEECADDNGDSIYSCHDRTNGNDYYKMNPKPQNVCFDRLNTQQPNSTITPTPFPTKSAITNGMCDIPFMLASHHYSQNRGDIFYYYWHTEGSMGGQRVTDTTREQQLQKLLTEMRQIPDTTTEMLLVSSYATAKHALANHAQELKSAGIEWIGYNMEGPPVSTPDNELNTMFLTSDQNSVALFAKLVESYGFKSMWGPIRSKVDRAPDGALEQMKQAGLDAVALQEQKFIETESADSRIRAVKTTTQRLRGIFGSEFGVFVQVMSVRCPEYSKCKQFTDGILDTQQMGLAGPVNGIAIWANKGGEQGSQLNGFMQHLCQNRT